MRPLERPSKTRRKSESHALQELGLALAELPDDRLDALALDEPLRDALVALRRIRAHEARRRQAQLIGALMRRADVESIRAAVDAHRAGHARDTAALHEAERWRAALVAGDDALTRFATAHPGIELQRLRALVRSARRDVAADAQQRSGRGARELFRFLRDHLSQHHD
jgi:ribosome-associated protein